MTSPPSGKPFRAASCTSRRFGLAGGGGSHFQGASEGAGVGGGLGLALHHVPLAGLNPQTSHADDTGNAIAMTIAIAPRLSPMTEENFRPNEMPNEIW